MTGLCRFYITERTHLIHKLDGRIITWATANDPPAQAMKKYTGVFDMRDRKYNAIVASATTKSLKQLRKLRAKYNTNDFFRNNPMI